MSPDDKKLADKWWARQIVKHPELANKYGQAVPLDDSGRIASNVVKDVQQRRTAETQVSFEMPAPVDWKGYGRDVTSGLANLATIPLLGKGQGAIERKASDIWGVEPRDFDVPEDSGFWRTVADPVLPTLGAVAGTWERFVEPAQALVWSEMAKSFQDSYNVNEIRDALREQGVGPLMAAQTAYQQGDIPTKYKIPYEVLTDPLELIPGIGMYSGVTRRIATAAARKAAREAGEQVAETAAREVVEEVAPTTARGAPTAAETIMGAGAGVDEPLDPTRFQTVITEGQETIQLKKPFRQTPVEQPMGPIERVIPESEVVSNVDGVRKVFDQEVPTTVDEVTSPAGQRFLPQLIDDSLELLGSIVAKGKQKHTVIRNLERELRKIHYVDDVIEGVGDLKAKIAEYRATAGQGARVAKQAIFDEVIQMVDDLTPTPRQATLPMDVTETTQIENVALYRQNVVNEIADVMEQNPGIFREEVLPGSDNLRNSINEFIRGVSTDVEAPAVAETLFGETYFNAETAFGRIRALVDELAPAVTETRRGTDVTAPIPTGVAGVSDTVATGVESILGTPRGTAAVVKQMELPANQTLANNRGRTQAVEETVNAAKNDGHQVASMKEPTTEAGRTYKDGLIDRTKQLEQTIRDMVIGIMPADIMRASVFKPAVWLNDQIGRHLITRYEGVLNSHISALQDFSIRGNRLLESVGIGERVRGLRFATERAYRLTDADWGTISAPGPMRILYRALHNEGNGINQWVTGLDNNGVRFSHPTMAADNQSTREEILKYLNDTTDFEESMRIDFDPKLGRIEDYFYRGWKSPEMAQGGEIPSNMARLVMVPSYTKSRSAATYMEMEASGFEPLFRNPFDQSVYSQQQGVKYRLQFELADLLMDNSVGLAHPLTDKKGLLELKLKHGVTFRVPQVGPAFEGKGYEIVNASGSEPIVWKAGQIAVPDKVADVLESIFRGGGTSWKSKSYRMRIPMIDKEVPINVMDIVDALVYIPKRLKLFASLFQVTDFMRRTGVGATHGVVDAVFHALNRGRSADEAFDAGRTWGEARRSANSAWEGWWEIISSYGAAGKTDHFRDLLRTAKDDTVRGTIKGAPIIEGTDFYWNDMVKNGLNVRDLTILPAEDAVTMINDIATTGGGALTKAGRAIKELEYSSRRGLFDRVYPAAIMTDVKFNLLPMAMRAYPNATPDQIMALVARQANLKYSTLLRSQSNINQLARELLGRLIFSVNENEGLIRQLMRAIKGEEKGFWATYWLSAGVFFALTATTIHAATSLVTEGELKGLPKERFIPIHNDRKGWWKLGYNSRFLSPDIPIKTRSGQKATIDMLGQLDTAGRIFDFQHVMGDTFISSRKGTTLGAFYHLIKGNDFYGRETDKFGWSGKLTQFMFDMAVPIGMGEAGLGLIRETVGDQPLPSAGAFIAPGTTVQDILPVGEPALGMAGMIAEATGENLKAPTTHQIQRAMILNVYPDEDAQHFGEIDRDKRLLVETDESNKALMEELQKRAQEGARLDNVYNEQRVERDKLKSQRMQAEQTLVDVEYDSVIASENTAFDSKGFKNSLSKISLEHRTRQDMITERFMEDPEMRRLQEEYDNLDKDKLAKERIERPIYWAYAQYLQLIDKHSAAFQEMDYEALEKDLAILQQDWGEELVARFDAYLADHKTEQHVGKVNEYYQAMKRLEEVGWFDNPRLIQMAAQWSERMPKRKDGTGLIDDWDKWLKGSVEEKRLVERTSFYRSTIKLLINERTRGRNQILMGPDGQEIDRYVIEWFGRNPAHSDNLPLYVQLYEVAPKRMASLSLQ